MNARQNKKYKDSPEILKRAIVTMRGKILEHEKEFIEAPLTIEVEMGDGRYVERANPLVQEYRSLIRDFSAALKAYKELTGEKDEPEINQLDNLRARFRVAK